MNMFTRQAASFRNEMRQQCGALLGIAQGMLADGELNDTEIHFLRDWLNSAETVRLTWPGDVIYAQIKAALEDGVVTLEERNHLVLTLEKLVGGALDELAAEPKVAALALDDVKTIPIAGHTFCLTGDFAYGPRRQCEILIEERGGQILPGITKKLNHLVIGGLGSPEWKHGSFGTKIEKAMTYKRDGVPLLVVHEDVWSASVFG